MDTFGKELLFQFLTRNDGVDLIPYSSLDDEKLLQFLEFPFDGNGENIVLWMENIGLYSFLLERKNITYYYGKGEVVDNLKNDFCERLLKLILPYIRKDNRYKSKCPDEGEFYGYKFVDINKNIKYKDNFYLGIMKLRIPSDAKRVCGILEGAKCRCSHAIVEEIRKLQITRIYRTSGTKDLIAQLYNTGDYLVDTVDEAYSFFYPHYKYKVGRLQLADSFNGDPWESCSNGIHFFMTIDEAIRFAKLAVMNLV